MNTQAIAASLIGLGLASLWFWDHQTQIKRIKLIAEAGGRLRVGNKFYCVTEERADESCQGQHEAADVMNEAYVALGSIYAEGHWPQEIDVKFVALLDNLSLGRRRHKNVLPFPPILFHGVPADTTIVSNADLPDAMTGVTVTHVDLDADVHIAEIANVARNKALHEAASIVREPVVKELYGLDTHTVEAIETEIEGRAEAIDALAGK